MSTPAHPQERARAAHNDDRVRLGAGRSGEVFAEVTPEGLELACKVFVPDRASTLVNVVLTGAANPYRWDPHAVRCAVLRRQLLEVLVDWWFDGALRLPVTEGSRWNERHGAYELRAERVQGRHTRLRHGFGEGAPSTEAAELRDRIMGPLQHHLESSGFDGLLWQAGRGNPVAAGNFMRDLTEGGARWVWIDAESGVPALFPLAFWTLLTDYLPLCAKHRRWLFDDVDTERLRRYLGHHSRELRHRLGPEGHEQLLALTDELNDEQWRWRLLRRHQRGVRGAEAAGTLGAERAEWYMERPVAWNLRQLGRGAMAAGRLAGRGLARLPGLVQPARWVEAVRAYGRFLRSADRRDRWAAVHVRRRLLHWRRRGMLDRAACARIRASMEAEQAAGYVADFGVHLAIKPAVKACTWAALPALALVGAADHWVLLGLLAMSGALARTAYTTARCVRALARGQRAPWVALGAGVVPVVGNVAFPLQLLAAGRGPSGDVARFLIQDVLSGVGRRLPVWGGPDTFTEHGLNAVGLALCDLGRPAEVAPVAVPREAGSHEAESQEVGTPSAALEEVVGALPVRGPVSEDPGSSPVDPAGSEQADG